MVRHLSDSVGNERVVQVQNKQHKFQQNLSMPVKNKTIRHNKLEMDHQIGNVKASILA